MEIDVKKIEEELGSLEDPYTYIYKLKNKIFSYKNKHVIKIHLMERLYTEKIPLIKSYVDDCMFKNIDSIASYIWKEIYKEVENNPINSYEKKFSLITLKWVNYIDIYNLNLKEMKEMLFECQNLISKNIEKWGNFASSSDNIKDIRTLLHNLKECESQEKVIVSTLLRRILETIFELHIQNNKKSIKKNPKQIGFSLYFKFLKDENIDLKIKTLLDHQCDDNNFNHYKYTVSKIWTSKSYLCKKIYNKLLSDNIHQQFKNFISFSYFDRINCIKKISDYINKKINELDKLRNFTLELYLSLQNHIVSFEKGGLTVIVRDFKIDATNLNEKYFDFDNNYRFEDVTKDKPEYLCDLLGINKK